MARLRRRPPVDAPGWLWGYDPAAWLSPAEWERAAHEWFGARDMSDPAVWDVFVSVISTPVWIPADG